MVTRCSIFNYLDTHGGGGAGVYGGAGGRAGAWREFKVEQEGGAGAGQGHGGGLRGCWRPGVPCRW